MTFAKVCREIRFDGSIKALWNKLDADKDGNVALCDVDADAAVAFEAFGASLLEKYATASEAWTSICGGSNQPYLDEASFVKGCDTMGISPREGSSWEQLHRNLISTDYYRGKEIVTLQDIVWLGLPYQTVTKKDMSWQGARHVSKYGLVGSESHFMAHESGRYAGDTIAFSSRKTCGFGHGVAKNSVGHKAAVGDSIVFLRLLRLRFGTTCRAWRLALTCGSAGGENLQRVEKVGTIFSKIGQEAFAIACRELGFDSAKAVLNELDVGQGTYQERTITFDTLDPVAAAQLAKFRERLLAVRSNALDAWRSISLDKKVSHLSEKEFNDGCRSLGIEEEAAHIHEYLISSANPSVKKVTLQDLVWLGVPLPAEIQLAEARTATRNAMQHTRWSLPASPASPPAERAVDAGSGDSVLIVQATQRGTTLAPPPSPRWRV
jgi:hypothetical protein